VTTTQQKQQLVFGEAMELAVGYKMVMIAFPLPFA
jgi:hypothetical protein